LFEWIALSNTMVAGVHQLQQNKSLVANVDNFLVNDFDVTKGPLSDKYD
jgi:hypothetical protein